MQLQTKNPGTKAGVGVLLGGEPDNLSEFALQAQALADKLRLSPHMARCILCLLRSDVW